MYSDGRTTYTYVSMGHFADSENIIHFVLKVTTKYESL